MSDFDDIRFMGRDYAAELPGMAETEWALGRMRQTQSQMIANQKQNEPTEILKGVGSVTVRQKPDGGSVMDFKDVDPRTFQDLLRSRQQLNEIMGSFHQEAARLQLQEQQMQQQPWMQLATALSANLAQARDMPGWVQAMGRTAEQLNPPLDVLRARRMAVMSQEAQIAERAEALDISLLRTQADTKAAEHLRRVTEDADKRAENYLKQSRLAVRSGSGEPMSYEAFVSGGVASGVAPERLPALYKAHVEEARLAAAGEEKKLERQKELKTFGESLSEKLQGVKQRDRMAQIQKSFENSISPTKEHFELKLFEQKEAIRTAAAGRREFTVLGPKPQTALMQASATNQYIGTVEHMLEQPEWAQVQGPLFQFNPATNEVKFNPQAILPKQFKNIDRTVVESQIAHEIPRLLTILLNSQAGGASILRIEAGQKLIRDMGITGSVRPDQALAIMKIVRDTNNNNIAAVMRLKKDANWPAMRDLIGADDPRNRYYFYGKKDSFGGPVLPFPSFERRETESTTGEPSFDDFEAWKKKRGGG